MKRSVLLIIVSALFLYFLIGHLGDWQQLATLFFHAKWSFLSIAVTLEIIKFYFFTKLYQQAFSIYEVKWRLKQLAALVLASVSLSLTAPLGPMSGATVFVGEAKERATSLFSTMAGIFVTLLSDFLALLLFLTLSVVLLAFRHQLMQYELVGYVIFVSVVLALFGVFVLAVKNHGVLHGLLRFSQGVLNLGGVLLGKKNAVVGTDWADRKTVQFGKMSAKLVEKRQIFNKLVGTAIYMRLTDMAALFFLFLAFGKLVPVVPLLAGYSVGMLFWIVSPTPQGVGFVESIMPVVFSSLGIDIDVATLATLAFRGLTLWLPALIGFVILRKLVKEVPSKPALVG